MGVILYLPDDNWDEQVHTVEFLSFNKLRRSMEEVAQSEVTGTNDNPALEWKFSSRNRHDNSTLEDEWLPGRHNDGASPCRELAGRTRTREDEEEFMNIREGHAALAVEIQKLKRELSSLTSQIRNQAPNRGADESCVGVTCVLPRLRYKLALKAQAGLRNVMKTSKRKSQNDSGHSVTVRTGDGIQTGIIKAKVDCTLRQFEDISRRVESNANPGTVTFIPGFAYTQFPSQTSCEFRILFSTFAELANHLGITSKADRLELVRKCGMGPQGDIVRLLGTYSFDKTEMSKPARIYLGSSCGSIIEVEKSLSSQRENSAAQHHSVLARKSREWNVIDKRFVHDVQMEKLPLPRLSDDTAEEEAFQIQWRRAPDLATRSWSRALIHSVDVQGWLEVILPFVQMQGRYLCVEIGGLASDDIWDDIL